MFATLTLLSNSSKIFLMTPEKYILPTDRFRREVGILIKTARNKAKISQKNLAQSIGLTRTSINNIEHGRQRIILDTLLIVSSILKTSIVDLLPKNFDIIQSFDRQIPKDTSGEMRKWILTEVLESN